MANSKSARSKPEGYLIDIDGVILNNDQTIKGAIDTIQFLNQRQIPYLFVTNTTRRSRLTLHTNLRRMGYHIEIDQIFSAPFAAARWLESRGVETIKLYLKGDAYREFANFRKSNDSPEYLVIGDLGDDLTFNNLNQAFRLLMNGSKLLALQKNRYWNRPDGITIDAGALVAALEYAARIKARIIGKPSAAFFDQALSILGLKAESVAMIGDDLDADIEGGAKAGLFTIAVETGKMLESDLKTRRKKPDLILPSIAALPKWIEKK